MNKKLSEWRFFIFFVFEEIADFLYILHNGSALI